MEKKVTIQAPRYQQIAADVAARIAEKQYNEGDKIYARSSIAAQYGVSSETARRAICVLSNLGIVKTTKGSGVVILSHEKAAEFIIRFKDIQSVSSLKNQIIDILDKQTQENQNLKKSINTMLDMTKRFKSINPFIAFEFLIDNKVIYIGKTISDISFWHNTSATIIGIKRNDTLLMSPGPYAVLKGDDIIYYVGDEGCRKRVHQFLHGK